MAARLLVSIVVAVLTIGCGIASRETTSSRPATTAGPTTGPRMPFEATAYSIEGTTAAGTKARKGIVAADPKVLPLGTRIRVHGAGRHSGEYVVRDTGPAIKGREIDVYIANDREAKRFGRKSVQVEVVQHAAR